MLRGKHVGFLHDISTNNSSFSAPMSPVVTSASWLDLDLLRASQSRCWPGRGLDRGPGEESVSKLIQVVGKTEAKAAISS